MTQKLIYNAHLLFTGILFSSLVIASCTKKLADEAVSKEDATINSRSVSKPVTLSTISLKVTINNSPGYNITSDNGGDYFNGTQNVQAIIDKSGTFVFNTNTSTRQAAIRWVNYNFNNPVDPTNTYRPTPSNTKNYHFSTGGSTFGTNPFIPLQNLGVNGNPATECIYMGNGIYNNTTGWRVSFHKGYEDVSNSTTAFAVVTRTSISPAVWTITPVGSCTTNSNVAALRSEDGTILYGYYNLPFHFTLTAR